MDQESFEQDIFAVLRQVPEQHRMAILTMLQECREKADSW